MKYLRNAEAFCAFFLPLLFCWKWLQAPAPVAWDLRMAVTLVMSYILLQGALYWHLKLQTFCSHQPLPGYFQRLYHGFKYSNVIAISGLVVLIATRSVAVTEEDLWWTCCILALVVAEQINYYHYQLMYDTRGAFAYLRRNGRLRAAALALDLKRGRTTSI